MLSTENRLSAAPPEDPVPAAGGAGVVPNPPLVCPKTLPLPVVAGGAAAKPLPKAPPVLAVAGKPNPEAEPNPDGAAAVLEDVALKEKEDAEIAEEVPVEEPNPEVGCVGAAGALPKPVEDGGGAEEPNPPLGAAKLKELAWTGAVSPKALLPKPDVEDPNPVEEA